MVMKDKLNDKGIEFLTDILSKGISKIKENHEWKKLFIDTGEFLVNSHETSESFKEDLAVIFSKENLSEISRKLKDNRGYNFTEILYNELYNLMLQYEVSPMEAVAYINHFSQMIIKYLEENDHDKTLEIFLGEWRKEDEERFTKYDKQLKLILEKLDSLKDEDKPLSISDIDAQIRRKSLFKGMSLDFFELDDEQFELDFQESIDKNRIFVIGKSREETTYRILNELKNKNSDKTVFVVSRQEQWKNLENSSIKGCILIPIFYAESISPIPNNTNIFVYGEEEPCYSEDKLHLRKRTRKNIISSLEKIGFESNDACKVVEKTHGLYSALKKKLFGDAIHNEPAWVKQRSDVVMAALLCGKWTESEGDKLIFEELSGEKYDDCKKELLPYSYGESPYVIQIKGYGGSNMQIASVEDAWEELDKYISDEMWKKFIKLFYEVLIESEPIFDYPFDKHFEASVYAAKPEWSQTLKSGMIRTLVMRAYYRQHVENQRQVDEVVSEVLNTITTKERWGYISQYFTELCEASPKAVLEKLENEFSEPTGMLELFSANDGDYLTGRHYYTHVLWAVEQLLQQKMYVKRAVDWLWEINDYDIKYSISNSPKSILETVYCAWLNVSVLSVEEKIESARKAVAAYNNAWEIIYDNLPKGNRAICSSLNTPKYRSVDEVAELYYVHEVNNTYIEYLDICVKNINGDAEKWENIIESLHSYGIKIQKDVLGKMIDACQSFSDLSKIQIKNRIRRLIYQHRFYKDAEWSMEDVSIQNYVNAFKKIVLDDKTYDFLYLFTSEYKFPLLNPVSYQREENHYRDENKELRDKEIETQFQIFKGNKYSLETLIKLAVKDDNCIMGEVLAQYYCKDIFDKEVFKLLLENDSKGKHVYDYVRRLYREGNIDLKEIIETIKSQCPNDILIANIIGLEVITNQNDAIIAGEGDEVKKEYWSRNLRIAVYENAGEDVWIWALDECKKYGILSSYLELLFEAKDKISVNTLYEKFLAIRNIEGRAESMTDYYLKEILEILQEEFRDDLEKCSEIILLEWFCRDVLEWHQMKCTQYIMKLDPTTYAALVKMIFKSDEADEANEEKKQLASKMYILFDKAQFCPAEKDGKVKYEDIKRWIEKFKELLKKQGQERLFGHLLGRLLAYSPIGDDGYMPCEAVRRIIEENFNDSLKSSYVIAEENKRGVHTVDDGKSEKLLAENYEKNAEKLREKYPKTAEIYFALRDSYKWQADSERRRAEDEF